MVHVGRGVSPRLASLWTHDAPDPRHQKKENADMAKSVRRHGNRVPKLLGLAAAAVLTARPIWAALPSGGNFVAGTGAIAAGAGRMTISQSSHYGIINWQNFSIGAGEKVQFNNGQGATLNRVTGTSVSAIAGELGATGSVYLINPNGVVIGPGGRVITNGDFVASTRDISNQNFLNGQTRKFSGESAGTVVNQGKIVSVDGSVVLIGQAVNNSGCITAAKGTVGLAAGNTVLLQPENGAGRIFVQTGTGDVTNSGAIAAAAAELRAADGNVYALAGNTTGLITATGSQVIHGQVWLTSDSGSVNLQDRIAAKNNAGTGGTITATGGNVSLSGGAALVADGTVGGTVNLIAANTTTVDGMISALGQSQGGFVDTSGRHVVIGAAAKVSTAAANGTFGQWLIDPTDYTIAATGGDITGAALSTELASSNVTILSSQGVGGTSGNINVNDAVSWSTNTTLTLSADANININANLTATGNTAGLVLTPNTGSAGGTVNFNGGVITLSGSGPSLTIAGNSYTVINSAATLQGLGSTGYYALGSDIDLSTISNFSPIGESAAFTGTFNGLGHTISNLTENNSDAFAGLFGQVGGGSVVENVGLVGGSITDTNATSIVGGLVGVNNGTVTDACATGNASGGEYSYVGGLVGFSTAGITDAYAGGSASGGSFAYVGGLVGFNNGGSITDAYATANASGSVGASFPYVGGLGGNNSGTIMDAYATGSVSGSGNNGGLVGNNNGTVTDGYYDSNTFSGAGVGGGSGSATGLTTTQLESALPTGFSTAVWANAGNTTAPYLLSSSNVQVLAGSVVSTLIFNASELQSISSNLSGNYALANNIDLSGISNFSPIGESTAFTGTFNGLGHTISNLTENNSDDYAGLFGQVGGGGVVENVGLVGGSITDTSGSYVGGLVGFNYGGSITDAYATGSVSSSGGGILENDVGGLVGYDQGSITDAYATGSVSVSGTGGPVLVGGLVGYDQGSISDAYATGNVNGGSGTLSAGGLVGYISNGSIADAYATGSVSGTDDLGGLVGYSYRSSIADAYATGSVTGTSNFGGLVGYGYNGSITDGYYDSNTFSGAGVGGGSGSATGLTTAQMFTLGSFTGFNASTTPGATGNAWVIVDADGSLNNANGATGGTLPMLASEWSTSISNAHQLQLMVLAPTATYTLAGNISAVNTGTATSTSQPDVWGASGFVPVGNGTAFTGYSGSNGFSGILNGDGYAISDLRIDNDVNYGLGLFSSVVDGGVVENVGLVGGSVAGTHDTGTLVGDLGVATVTDVYSSAGITSSGGSVGGLVGFSVGTVNNAYSIGTIDSTSTGAVGEIIGRLGNGSYTPTVADVYADGTVSGSGGDVGAAVGWNDAGVISDAYWNTAMATAGVGSQQGTVNGGGPLSSSQMMQQSSFTGFDFTTPTWVIYQGHTTPLLNAFLTPLTITAGGAIQTYNGSSSTAVLNSPTYSVSGAATSGNLLGLSTPYAGDINVGTYTPQLWSDQQGYRITLVGGGLTINPAPLTVSGTSVVNRTYNGTTGISLTGATLAGTIYGSHVVALANDSTGTLVSANAGSEGVTTSMTLSGAAAGNYVLTQPTGLTADIAQATLTETAQPTALTSGSPIPLLSGSITGFVGADTQANSTTGTLVFTTDATNSSPVGSYAIDGSGLTPDGNYRIVQAPSNATALTISRSQAPLNIDLIGYWFTPYYSSSTESGESGNDLMVPAMSNTGLGTPWKIFTDGGQMFIYEEVDGVPMLLFSSISPGKHSGGRQSGSFQTKDAVIRLLSGGGTGMLYLKPRHH